MTLAQIHALLPSEATGGRTRRAATGTGADLMAMAKMGGR